MTGHGRLAFLGGASLTRAIRSVACPHCEAGIGQPCVMYRIVLPIDHLTRIERAKKESTEPNPSADRP